MSNDLNENEHDAPPATAIEVLRNISAPVLLSRTYITGPSIVNDLRNMRAELSRLQQELTDEWRMVNGKEKYESHPCHYDFEGIKNNISSLMGKLL